MATDPSADGEDFSNVSWSEHVHDQTTRPVPDAEEPGHTVDTSVPSHATPQNLGSERLDCTVDTPIKENDGTKDAFVSYLITTSSTFPSFQREHTTVRRRFTDFVFLYKQLARDHQAAAVPPLPDKQRMEYVRGDRFGSDFTARRAHSLQRFLMRLSLHPVLRRSPILHSFLESPDWNATMRSRGSRASSGDVASGAQGVFDGFADTFINAFTKVHKPDRRFLEVKEKSDKLDDDLSHIEKIVSRVARREADLKADLHDLAEQFQKLMALEPGIEPAVHAFAASIEDSAANLHRLHDVTEQDYLGSLRDMQAYSLSLRQLLKARETKQLDHEQLIEYLNKTTSERDSLQNHSHPYSSSSSSGPGGFLRNKIEDVRGVDHEQARRERARKLELKVEELTAAVENAKRDSDGFDEEVVREVANFERIKRAEFKNQLGGLADSHVQFYGDVQDLWERYVKEMEGQGVEA